MDMSTEDTLNVSEQMDVIENVTETPEDVNMKNDEIDDDMETEEGEDSLESKFEADSFKRFELLLKKTENFSHCLSAGDVAAYKGSPQKKKRGRHLKTGVDGDHRHRKTEQEEDEEMAEAARKEDDIMVFDKNPFYIQNGELSLSNDPYL
ncbi:hypothetical protein DICVIV_03566 [Dictyocaulus viviparus]|uniref:Uncharacterized protein n=1 Tax=Dictyocaulus viviparus TaxID=29172 RepID=A0A0D8Y0A1_DICVI|nr:hypothetical protein DICVIV_03566 [Dictyocaulus viviparus]